MEYVNKLKIRGKSGVTFVLLIQLTQFCVYLQEKVISHLVSEFQLLNTNSFREYLTIMI